MDGFAILAAILAAAAPLMLAAVGESLSERAGVINLSLDGSILISALAAFAGARASGDPCLGLLAGAACGLCCAALLGVFSLGLGISQVAAGFVLTLFYRDLAYFLGQHLSRQSGPQFAPFAFMQAWPVLGPLLGRLNPLVYLALGLALWAWWHIFRTPAGLRLRAVGESPRAAYGRGLKVMRVRVTYLLLGGALCGLAGGAYSLAVKPGWGNPQGAEGAGWIALAIVIFGGFSPLRAALGALIFAGLQVAGIYLQDYQSLVPPQVLQLSPLMILVLFLGNLGRSRRLRALALTRPWLARLLSSLGGRAPAGMGRSSNPADEF